MSAVLAVGFDALAYGTVLFTISVGLSVALGLMRVVNLAHGAFAMLGGYLASFVAVRLGWGFVPALLLAVAGTVLLAVPLERYLYRRVYGGGDHLPQILLSVGITFVVIGLANWTFGPTMKPIPLPPALSGPVDLGFRVAPAHRLFAIASGLAVAGALWWLVERTAFGVRLRAAVDAPGMAAALGIRTDRLYAATFALSVGLAAFGGVVGAEIMPIEPYYALRYMVVFLVVVSVGGAGSIGGALVASLTLGLVDVTSKYLVPNLGEFCFYLAVIAVILLFPRGLMARAE